MRTSEPSEVLEAKWKARLTELLQYKDKYGDCNVPFSFKEGQKLANWVLKQRKFYRKGQLPIHRIQQLEDVGFEWTSYRRVTWEQRYEQLCEFRKVHGHCLVQEDATSDPATMALAQWVKKQRTTLRKQELGNERAQKLDAIGFVWNIEDSSWESRFLELVQFQRDHGNISNPKDAGLKGWVYRQRNKFKEGTLSQDKVQRLQAVGFQFGMIERAPIKSTSKKDPQSKATSPSKSKAPSTALSSLVDACFIVSEQGTKADDDWSTSVESAHPEHVKVLIPACDLRPTIIQLHQAPEQRSLSPSSVDFFPQASSHHPVASTASRKAPKLDDGTVCSTHSADRQVATTSTQPLSTRIPNSSPPARE